MGKEEMTRLFEIRDPEAAGRGWCPWFEAAKARGIPQLEHFARIKKKRLPGLISHATHPISTGKLEGFNNNIKVSKRIGYGYRQAGLQRHRSRSKQKTKKRDGKLSYPKNVKNHIFRMRRRYGY